MKPTYKLVPEVNFITNIIVGYTVYSKVVRENGTASYYREGYWIKGKMRNCWRSKWYSITTQ